MTKFSDNFIMNTAIDYDMTFEEVQNISKKYPNFFYEELENFIKEKYHEYKRNSESC